METFLKILLVVYGLLIGVIYSLCSFWFSIIVATVIMIGIVVILISLSHSRDQRHFRSYRLNQAEEDNLKTYDKLFFDFLYTLDSGVTFNVTSIDKRHWAEFLLHDKKDYVIFLMNHETKRVEDWRLGSNLGHETLDKELWRNMMQRVRDDWVNGVHSGVVK